MSELKAVAEYLGFKPEDGKEVTIDDIKATVQKDYVAVAHIGNRKDLIDPFISQEIGKFAGSTQTALISNIKDLGIEVAHSDYSGKKITEILPDVFGKIKARFDEFKTAKPDEVLQKKFEQREKEFSTLSEQYQKTQQEFDGYKSQVQADKINTAKKLIQQSAYGGVNWKTNASELEKTGFRATIENQYDIEVAEDGSHFAVHRIGDKKGSRVSNPSVANKFMTFDELVKHEATTLKLIADPREGNSTRPTHQPQQRQTQVNEFGEGQRPIKRLNPRAGVGG
jgi:hypothetical protein